MKPKRERPNEDGPARRSVRIAEPSCWSVNESRSLIRFVVRAVVGEGGKSGEGMEKVGVGEAGGVGIGRTISSGGIVEKVVVDEVLGEWSQSVTAPATDTRPLTALHPLSRD